MGSVGPGGGAVVSGGSQGFVLLCDSGEELTGTRVPVLELGVVGFEPVFD